jgi:AraC-like DNA-binding protein
MKMPDTLYLKMNCPLKAQNAGLFISRGIAKHPTRIIDSHELIFVKQGELDMWENDQIFHLAAGQTLHLWPGRRHGSTKVMPLGLKFYWIHFEVEESNNGQPHAAGEDFTPVIKMPQMALINQPERLERLFRMFLDDQETGVLHPHVANLLTTLMLIEVAQSYEEKVASPEDLTVVATWAHTYIRINYDRPITTARIAEALGYNPDYLGRIYHKVYGCTLTDAIHRRRVGMACNYLLDTQLTIEQIAEKCGFVDPDYFRRIFRRHMQISPGRYRNEYSHIHVNTD